MAILEIMHDGEEEYAPIADPQTLQWDEYDLDSEEGTGRNQQGDAFRDRVHVKRKLTCKWPPLTQSQMATLLARISPAFFMLKFPDAKTGARAEMRVYAGDRSAPIYNGVSDTDWLWENLSMNFIER